MAAIQGGSDDLRHRRKTESAETVGSGDGVDGKRSREIRDERRRRSAAMSVVGEGGSEGEGCDSEERNRVRDGEGKDFFFD